MVIMPDRQAEKTSSSKATGGRAGATPSGTAKLELSDRKWTVEYQVSLQQLGTSGSDSGSLTWLI